MAVEVALESSHGSHLYASAVCSDISATWQQYKATMTSNATDSSARLAVRLQVALLISLSCRKFLHDKEWCLLGRDLSASFTCWWCRQGGIV